jgi:uncharacterized protein (TIGR04255 family)
MAAKVEDFFPASPRVIYGNAPLVQVIAQVRFPTLLKIESEPPAHYQEEIRATFPILERPVSALTLGGIAQQLPQEISRLLGPAASTVSYQFITEDRRYSLTLTPDSLALSTSGYERWELFSEKLVLALRALLQVYQPSFYSRVGLRYTNAIDRTLLGLADKPWSELIRSELLGEAALTDFESNLQELTRLVRVKLPDGRSSMQVQHGLGMVAGHDTRCYVLDFDYFTEEKCDAATTQTTLDGYNALSGRAFQWSITKKLHTALAPLQIDGGA